jgi:hypothetical protein
MKRALSAIALLCLAAPAIAQQGATEIEHEGQALINQWIAAYNRGDAEAMAAIHVTPDDAALEKTFADLRADSFGKLDVYSAAFCGKDSAHGKAIVKFARIYTFGGQMNGDEAKIFDIAKTDAGWRITGETDAPYGTVLTCS